MTDRFGIPVDFRYHTDRPIDLLATLGPLRHGPYDPAFRVNSGANGEPPVIWWTARFESGPATFRFRSASPRLSDARSAHHGVDVTIWGDGAADAVDHVPGLLGEYDDATGFIPPDFLRRAARRYAGMRITRSARVLDAVIPAVLEQRIQSAMAWRSWSWLLRRYGEPAPGGQSGMFTPPDASSWARIPAWDFHRAGVDPARARTVVAAARVAGRLEECTGLALGAARGRLQAVPGIGVWTAAKVAQCSLGDADAVHTGDIHLANSVGWAFEQRRSDDDHMLEILAPYRPHRYRLLRLMELAGMGRAPRRGPKLSFQDHRRN